MQIWLLKQRFITYCQSLKFAYDNVECNGVVLDRSIFADSVFAEKNFIDNNYSREGYDCYLELRKKLLAKLPLPDAIVYLNASAKTCAERVNSRARDCESGIPLAYLEGLNTCYQNFVQDFQKRGAGVLELEWEIFGEIEETVNKLEAVLEKNNLATSESNRTKELYNFVCDKEAVCRLRDSMQMVDEALGPEGVMAPVPWHAEIVLTPTPMTRKRVLMSGSSNSSSSSTATTVDPSSPMDELSEREPVSTPTSSPEEGGLGEETERQWDEMDGQRLEF